MPPLLDERSGNGSAPKVSIKLRTAQMRILRALYQTRCPMRKSAICEMVAHEFPTAAKFQEWMADPIGAADPANRPAAEKRAGYPSLLTLGLVSTKQLDIDGVAERTYEITQEGVAFMESLTP